VFKVQFSSPGLPSVDMSQEIRCHLKFESSTHSSAMMRDTSTTIPFKGRHCWTLNKHILTALVTKCGRLGHLQRQYITRINGHLKIKGTGLVQGARNQCSNFLCIWTDLQEPDRITARSEEPQNPLPCIQAHRHCKIHPCLHQKKNTTELGIPLSSRTNNEDKYINISPFFCTRHEQGTHTGHEQLEPRTQLRTDDENTRKR
jgi:hypothetical protein